MLQIILSVLAFLIGFFFSSVFDTTIAEFQEWSIVGAALIVASFELINKIFYFVKSKNLLSLDKNYYIIKLLDLMNYLKVGLIYGLIVDSFKLGS